MGRRSWGVAWLVLGAGGFLWSAPLRDRLNTGFGQLAMAMSSDAASQGQMVMTVYYGSIVVMVLGGVLLLGSMLGEKPK